MANKHMKPVKVEGVRGYVDKNNVAWLNAEDIARKFALTATDNDLHNDLTLIDTASFDDNHRAIDDLQ